MSKVLVCPVAYNENVKVKGVIERFLDGGLDRLADCLIVDDASDDGTSGIIAGYAPRGIRSIRHETRRGVGSAIRTAIKQARQEGYDALLIMAGNGKDDPKEIPDLINPILNGHYDFVQGSRYKAAGRPGSYGARGGAPAIRGAMPFYRRLATRVHPWMMSLIARRRVSDSTNGFRAFRLSIFDDPQINIDQPWLDHYELEPYLLYKVLKLGYKFTEVPVTKVYPPKSLGYTKMRPFIDWWSILRPLVYLGLGLKK